MNSSESDMPASDYSLLRPALSIFESRTALACRVFILRHSPLDVYG